MSNIEDRLDRLEQKLDAILTALKTSGGGARSASASAGGGQELDADIDGPRGDPEVRFVPKRWTGADHKGRTFSASEPEFLDMLADAYDWFAQRDDEQNAVDKNGGPKSKWSRLDAARARAWSARLRGQNGGGDGDAPAPRARVSSPGASANGRRPAPAPAPSYGRQPMNDFGDATDNDDIPF
jgi:hypothetical protein